MTLLIRTFVPLLFLSCAACTLSDVSIILVDDLWAQVEIFNSVEMANCTTVLDTPVHIDKGPDPLSSPNYKTHTLTESRISSLRFPKGFLHGVASSAAQVEGAVKADSRGPSLWDSYCHLTQEPGESSCQTMDIGTNFRHLFKPDVARVASMGVKGYSISISWSRVMPLGRGEMSQEGLQYYKDLIDEIVAQEMKPVVTLFHWDMPLYLELLYGGFSNESVIEDFASYAQVLFNELSSHGVDMWLTFSDPQSFCLQHYPTIRAHIHGLDISEPEIRWKCAGNVLRAHAKAVSVFRNLKKGGTISHKARISFKNGGAYDVPWRQRNKEDEEALNRSLSFDLGLFADPIHGNGDFSAMVREEVPREWLLGLSEEEKKMVKGSADFFATNFYASGIAKATETHGGFSACIGNVQHPAWPECVDQTTTLPDDQLLGEKSDSSTESWLMNTAGTLRRHLKYVYDKYESKDIYITELGWSERGGADKKELADIRLDDGRERYLLDHLAEMLLAIYKDGVPLKGCLIWSGTDSVEWYQGRRPRFGLQGIDFTQPDLPRTILNSFFFVQQFFQKHL